MENGVYRELNGAKMIKIGRIFVLIECISRYFININICYKKLIKHRFEVFFSMKTRNLSQLSPKGKFSRNVNCRR